MRLRLALFPLLALLVSASGCSSAPTQASINQSIYTADQAVTTILESTDAALNAHLITPQQAQSVSVIAHQVNPLLDSARAANAANNPTSANQTMNLVNALLAGLTAYVPSTPKTP